ncbi:MAG: helix-turn-helix transcriptional regulator [Lachnospiraceae bacterium]|nr:helix-turn-helix transcriptional regulator [Lachnospiraceae bacterium]
MFVKSDRIKEKEIISDLISSDEKLKKQHELFEAEMKFKQALIEARLAEQLTQNDVSLRSGLSQQAVSRLERGNGASLETIMKYLMSIGYSLTITKV